MRETLERVVCVAYCVFICYHWSMGKILVVWDASHPLERCQGESRNANAALRDYALMGSGRSLRKLLARYDGRSADDAQTEEPPTRYWSTLSGWSCKFDWVARVARWDEIQHEQAVREFEAARRADRTIRIKTLQSWRGKLIKAMQNANPLTASWHEITAGLRMVTQELRVEYGEVEQRVEVSVGGNGPAPASAVAGLSDDELRRAVRNLMVGVDGILVDNESEDEEET